MGFDIYVQLKCPKCGKVRDNPVAAPDYTGTYEPQAFRNLVNAVGIGECGRCAAASRFVLTPADLDNLKAIRMAVNRTAYHGGLGLRESGKMLGTLDRLLAAYGVGPDDQPQGGRPEQSIPERPGWPP